VEETKVTQLSLNDSVNNMNGIDNLLAKLSTPSEKSLKKYNKIFLSKTALNLTKSIPGKLPMENDKVVLAACNVGVVQNSRYMTKNIIKDTISKPIDFE
jgi:methylthioribose-1-phosphate isomerase